MKNIGKNFISKQSSVYYEQSPPWFYGVISMLKGSKSQKNVKHHDFPKFPIAACANFQEGSEKDSCPMWNDGEFFSHTLYSLWKLCAKF